MKTIINRPNTIKTKILLSFVLIGFTGLLSINPSYASPDNDHKYKNERPMVNSRHHSPRKRDHGYSRSRDHNQYPRHTRRHDRPRHYRPHNQHYYRQRYYSNHGHYQSYYPSYGHHVSYSTYDGHHNAVATIVGGAIGGAIAHDISGGDGAATAIGVLSGVVIAGSLHH